MNKLTEVLKVWLGVFLVIMAIPVAAVGVVSFAIWDLPDITLSGVLSFIRFSVALSGLMILAALVAEKFYD